MLSNYGCLHRHGPQHEVRPGILFLIMLVRIRIPQAFFKRTYINNALSSGPSKKRRRESKNVLLTHHIHFINNNGWTYYSSYCSSL